jgi:hypothetical protein
MRVVPAKQARNQSSGGAAVARKILNVASASLTNCGEN